MTDVPAPKPVTKTKIRPIGKDEKLCNRCNRVLKLTWFADAPTNDGKAHVCIMCANGKGDIGSAPTPAPEPSPTPRSQSKPKPAKPKPAKPKGGARKFTAPAPLGPITLDDVELTPIPLAAKSLDIPESTLRDAIARGKVPVLRHGNNLYVSLDECKEWLKTTKRLVKSSTVTLDTLYAELQEIKRLLLARHSGGLTDERTD